jgi:hypothetical protein
MNQERIKQVHAALKIATDKLEALKAQTVVPEELPIIQTEISTLCSFIKSLDSKVFTEVIFDHLATFLDNKVNEVAQQIERKRAEYPLTYIRSAIQMNAISPASSGESSPTDVDAALANQIARGFTKEVVKWAERIKAFQSPERNKDGRFNSIETIMREFCIRNERTDKSLPSRGLVGDTLIVADKPVAFFTIMTSIKKDENMTVYMERVHKYLRKSSIPHYGVEVIPENNVITSRDFGPAKLIIYMSPNLLEKMIPELTGKDFEDAKAPAEQSPKT